MDPISALGAAAATVQFISFITGVISKGREIYGSADGSLVSQAELNTVVQSLKRLCLPIRDLEGRYDRYPVHRLQQHELDLKRLCKGCIRATEDIERALEQLKVKGSHHRKWRSFRQALNAVRSEEVIDQLRRQMEQYRSQIDTTMLFILRREVDQLRAEQITSSEEMSKIMLGSVNENKKWQAEIISAINSQNWNSQNQESVNHFSTLLTASTETERKQMVEADILRRLQFDTMSHREERIPDAYHDTFEWVFHTPPIVGGEKLFDDYEQWLKGDEKLYWITGKPGAGKSTLTKFLSHDVRTQSNASLWSQSKELICAGYFFWNSGTELQMSKEGLLRTLLFQVISQMRYAIPTIFRKTWKSYENWGEDPYEWSLKDLRGFFNTVVSGPSYKYLIFIDGLDEMAGDQAELIRFILEVAQNTNVKLCVASRPWLAFEEAFGKRPRLRIENLTKPDIKRYVSEKMRSSERFLDLQRNEPANAKFLIDEVTGKAQGVFLWVYLVVRSLHEGLRDGDGMQDLRERISLLPSDLEELFRKILDRLDTSYFRQASMLFQLVDAALPRPLTVLCVAFAGEGLGSAMTTPVKTLSPGQRASQAESVRRKLNSRSKGLLEATPVDSDPDRAQVQYLHRTVKDFLARRDIWQYVISGTDDSFNPSVDLAGAYLLHLKTIDPVFRISVPYRDWNTPVLKALWDAIRGCLDHGTRVDRLLTERRIPLYDEMDKTVTALFGRCSNLPQDFTHWTNSSGQVLSGEQECKAWVVASPFTNFFEYAFYYGLYHYVEEKISAGVILINHRLKGRTLLHRASQNNDTRMIRWLLELGADPNLPCTTDRTYTPWQTFVQQLDSSYRTNTETWFELVTLFLDHGADANALVYTETRTRHNRTSRAYAILETSFGIWDFSRMKELLQDLAAKQTHLQELGQLVQILRARKHPRFLLGNSVYYGGMSVDYPLPEWATTR